MPELATETLDTEAVVAALTRRRDTARAVGRLVEVRDLDQQIIAHQTIDRLAAEQAALVEAGDVDAAAALGARLQFWVRQVDLGLLDVDEPAPAAADVDPDRPASRTAKRAR